MSRRKIKTPESIKARKLKRYLFKGARDEKEYQAWCQRQAQKKAKLKRIAEEEKKKAKADEESKADM
jgi:hypothetical protein